MSRRAGWALALLAVLGIAAFLAPLASTSPDGLERVAERLGNTPSVCRKCYVHPAVIDAYMDGSMLETLRQRTEAELTEELTHLAPEEAAVLALLRQRLANAS